MLTDRARPLGVHHARQLQRVAVCQPRRQQSKHKDGRGPRSCSPIVRDPSGSTMRASCSASLLARSLLAGDTARMMTVAGRMWSSTCRGEWGRERPG